MATLNAAGGPAAWKKLRPFKRNWKQPKRSQTSVSMRHVFVARLTIAVINTSYAVTRQAGGLEGCKPSKIIFFWPVTATNVAVTGQKQSIWERLHLSQTPPRKSCKGEP